MCTTYLNIQYLIINCVNARMQIGCSRSILFLFTSKRTLLWVNRGLKLKHLCFKAAFKLVSLVFGNFDDELHWVFGLVAESPSNGIHRMLMCDTLKGLSIYRHQLESSLHTQIKEKFLEKFRIWSLTQMSVFLTYAWIFLAEHRQPHALWMAGKSRCCRHRMPLVSFVLLR